LTCWTDLLRVALLIAAWCAGLVAAWQVSAALGVAAVLATVVALALMREWR